METPEKLVLSGADVFPVAEAFLKGGKKTRFTVSGNSMWPLIRHNRDSVLLSSLARPVKAGDIVLYHRDAAFKQCILHRVHRVKGETIMTMGDGCLALDAPVAVGQVIGRVEKVYRGKLTINCDAPFWRSVFWLWRIGFPIRRGLLRALRKAARVRRQMKKTRNTGNGNSRQVS